MVVAGVALAGVPPPCRVTTRSITVVRPRTRRRLGIFPLFDIIPTKGSGDPGERTLAQALWRWGAPRRPAVSLRRGTVAVQVQRDLPQCSLVTGGVIDHGELPGAVSTPAAKGRERFGRSPRPGVGRV